MKKDWAKEFVACDKDDHEEDDHDDGSHEEKKAVWPTSQRGRCKAKMDRELGSSRCPLEVGNSWNGTQLAICHLLLHAGGARQSCTWHQRWHRTLRYLGSPPTSRRQSSPRGPSRDRCPVLCLSCLVVIIRSLVVDSTDHPSHHQYHHHRHHHHHHPQDTWCRPDDAGHGLVAELAEVELPWEEDVFSQVTKVCVLGNLITEWAGL